MLIDLEANSMAKIDTLSLIIRERDLFGRTIAELFAGKGYLKETPELIAAYDRSSERYFAWRAEHGRQFSARGTGCYAEDPSASHRNTDWSRKSLVVLSSSGGWARLINDEDTIKDRALIRYQPPNRDQRRRIREVMSDQFALNLDPPILDWLAGNYPQTSGRDIKGLAKLVAKYCHHKSMLPEKQVFRPCSDFRGLEPTTDG